MQKSEYASIYNVFLNTNKKIIYIYLIKKIKNYFAIINVKKIKL